MARSGRYSPPVMFAIRSRATPGRTRTPVFASCWIVISQSSPTTLTATPAAAASASASSRLSRLPVARPSVRSSTARRPSVVASVSTAAATRVPDRRGAVGVGFARVERLADDRQQLLRVAGERRADRDLAGERSDVHAIARRQPGQEPLLDARPHVAATGDVVHARRGVEEQDERQRLFRRPRQRTRWAVSRRRRRSRSPPSSGRSAAWPVGALDGDVHQHER